ncbi:hypothetical protein FW778_20335 [Ginsengibacter hankyongi]|uniref:Porin n=1 Tax=Ginsengibacter hankyongi TaxID=2607284 RepID=A0A5J5IDJ5_9BACT|nr:hypothetical protein [Ginsengibacter hankyongi]KAA9035900.1 hypothetical protein FW778_20335 [Ginsengibacter hankyongi]
MKKLLLICFTLLVVLIANAQDSTDTPKKFTINAYIKSLQTLTFDKNFKDLVSGNLIHNRINIKWRPSENFTAVAEFRNRLFWGEDVKLTPGFASLLRNENELVNMQKVWINNKALVLHTNVERLYIDYQHSKWNARIGRQRINWGITTTWNPNDIFNTYNFLDFDYEERPGVDGGKVRYMVNSSSNAELAYSNTGKKDGDIAAIKYSLNKWNYDMQLITGWYKNHPTLGAGWAGYIKDAGFKGEVQYFFANKDSAEHFTMTLEGDYMFKKGWYVNVGMLFNNDGLYKPINSWDTINLKLSPENLMPTKWNVIVTTAKEFTPLLSANISMLYAPGTNIFIFFPTLQYNIATNLDVNLVWQSFFAEIRNNFEAVSHRCFLRLKWNF